MNKNVDSCNVPVSKLCTLNVGRTLVLLLEWCDRWLEKNDAVLRFVPSLAGHRPASLTPTDIVSFTNLIAFALYNHACYNNY